MDPEDRSIVYIYLLNPTQEGAEAVARSRISFLVYQGTEKVREVKPVQGRYTYDQLEKWFGQFAKLGILEDIPWTIAGVDGKLNSILVGVDCEVSRQNAERDIAKQLAQVNIPLEAVTVEISGGFIQPIASTPEFHCAPDEVVDPSTGVSSPGFGGMFWESGSSESGILNVYMLKPTVSGAEDLALHIWGRNILKNASEVHALQGQYTWERLLEWDGLIKDDMFEIAGVDRLSLADPTRNRLTIRIRRDKNPDVETEVEDLLSRFGIPIETATLLEE